MSHAPMQRDRLLLPSPPNVSGDDRHEREHELQRRERELRERTARLNDLLTEARVDEWVE